MSNFLRQTLALEENGIYLDEKHPHRENHLSPEHARGSSTLPQHMGIRPGNKFLRVCQLIFVPSFLRSSTKSASRPNAGLMALDGLRGLACLAVVNQRMSLPVSHDQNLPQTMPEVTFKVNVQMLISFRVLADYTSTFTARIYHFGWGTYPQDKNLAQFPFVKILWSGSAQVFTFFVLSGYVLSYKPIKQMRNRSSQVQKTLSSSIFRRGMRLFIPAFAMVAIIAVAAQVGIYKWAQAAAEQGLMDHLENIPPQQPNIWYMFNTIWNDFATMTNITNWGYVQPSLHPHLWTIIIEFRVSMLLYLVQTGTARLKSWARVLVAGYMFFWFSNTLTPVGSQTALFFAGMILAEADLALLAFRESHSAPSTGTYVAWDPNRRPLSTADHIARLTDPKSIYWRAFHIVVFLVGMFFLSCPYNGSEVTPVYRVLVAWLNPSWYKALEHSYWLWSVGAMCLLSSAAHSCDIQWIYTNSFSQYAGKVSFALYLAHGPVLHCVEYSMLPFLAAITEPLGGRETQLGFLLQWIMGAIVSIPIVFYFADMVYRLLDVPSVQFARWCEEKFEEAAWQVSSSPRTKG
ncbi:uncharacterized protein HMPREF1541_09089 [Cyphellophora europaea CBS 101466]|uniref:Acyltransferase 3 domain-containing protein n=1 Tax=Cyphellophora europaea (strain CBS 101466) TaxID=1220924 RepID=W2SB57_CYPE1|nr:uncharacterized protein HMPREF1541_09089 [Cyphellophora europaea CBS 101466]ETN45258.1 hypothetical protein HMPREF1541_09089 [Cyphellophora europaea CBS 101466]